MGSVGSCITCENCGNEEAYEEYYYKTGEFYISCDKCGYRHNAYFKRDDQGDLILKDPNAKIDGPNLIPVEEILKNPYGAFIVKYTDGISSIGSLESEEAYDEFLNKVKSDEDMSMVQSVVINRYVDKRFIAENIYP